MNNIKSFVCRYRKLKKSKQIIFNKYFHLFNISYKKKKLNFINIFNNKLPIIIDIGFGIDNNIINFARHHIHYNFIGIEVYLPGIINCIQKIKKNKIKNLKLIYYDAFFVFKNMIPDDSIKLIQLYFPDPWPKIKHKKRRLLKIDFLKIIFLKLKNNGLLYIITDCLDYRDDINSNIKNINFNNKKFIILKSNQHKNIYKNLNFFLLKTKFFNKAKKKKRNIYYLEYKKILFLK
ncbi:tRNA (guanosine(46)-N7)-methyltransferase TrmB [Enterobacteriaceae endosymbiont of Donacia marginata]|uniref:tRNA (guanosine(46)-N7)-methyltransferase TrmB n=1 Tax=Enterobacteriaceae endosymbiont of Donacia marginata TaxID=2675779 RepID=UPI0014490270|nr:tRNA (guanosine(46)-N7)-methyltransferase TrmB [Enterobacteriaceae endosymbiont of Donacia marginata]QJC38200.1 tRNA (guanosine(46)-N7)-methyltransferase TrmB [Enterobacteriaceae endosymbiont of Donacia marginata]